MAPCNHGCVPGQDPSLFGKEGETLAAIPWYKKDLRELGWPIRTAAWTGIVLAAVFALYLMIGLYGHIAIKYEMGNIFPVDITGRSMEPTIHQPIQIGSLSFGAIIWINREADRPVDSILLFYTREGVVEAKRVEKKEDTRNGPRYWFATDNSGMTGESSGFGKYKWIGDDQVVGRVVAIWTPRRFFRWFPEYGRRLNRVEFAHHPSEIFIRGRHIVVSCSNKVTSGQRELSGWSVEGWADKTSFELRLVRQAIDKKEYSLLNVNTWKLLLGRNADGSQMLPSNVHKQFAWGEVSGPLVYAMDDNQSTSWLVSSTNSKVTTSSISFTHQTKGTLVIQGGGDAAAVVEILADGRMLATGCGMFNELRVLFDTRKLVVRFVRHDPNATSGIGDAHIEGLSASRAGPSFFCYN